MTARTKSYTVEVTSVDGDTGEFSTVLRIDGHEKRDYMDMVLEVSGFDSKTEELLPDGLEDIAEAILSLEELRKSCNRAVYSLRQALIKESKRSGATQFSTRNLVIDVKKDIEYDRTSWKAIAEYVPMEELIEEKAFVPAHTETVEVPDKWDLGKVKKFFKRGSVVKEIIDRSGFDGITRVAISRKDGVYDE